MSRDSEARDQREQIIVDHAGATAQRAMNAHWRKATFTTWEEALVELAAGITVTTSCDDTDTDTVRRHRLRFHPDGSVEPLDHPGMPVDAEQERYERFLLAMSEQTPPDCRHAALVLPRRSPVLVYSRDPATNPFHRHRRIGVHLRTLHALVQWARDPDAPWDRGLCERTLRFGITPAILRTWEAADWTVGEALPWLHEGIDLATATQWRTAGRGKATDARACRLAEPVAGDDWTRAGFTSRQAMAWRRIPKMTLAEATAWHSRGFTVTTYKEWTRHTWRGFPDKDTVFAWADAGGPTGHVIEWLTRWPHYLSGCSLEEKAASAAEWARHGFGPDAWNLTRADHPAEPDVAAVAALRDVTTPAHLRYANDYTPLARLAQAGITPAQLARCLARTGVAGTDPADVLDTVVKDLLRAARAAHRPDRST